jgi:hypothetical protein
VARRRAAEVAAIPSIFAHRSKEDRMNEIARLSRDVKNGFAGDPWHGSSVMTILANVDARLAASHPIEGTHSIWEIVLHLTAWTKEVVRRLEGAHPQLPIDGDWPPVRETDPASWEKAMKALAEAHDVVLKVLGRFPPASLDKIVGGHRMPAIGTGVSFHAMVNGLVQHDAYHGGQIALLKRARSSS